MRPIVSRHFLCRTTMKPRVGYDKMIHISKQVYFAIFQSAKLKENQCQERSSDKRWSNTNHYRA